MTQVNQIIRVVLPINLADASLIKLFMGTLLLKCRIGDFHNGITNKYYYDKLNIFCHKVE